MIDIAIGFGYWMGITLGIIIGVMIGTIFSNQNKKIMFIGLTVTFNIVFLYALNHL
jgi:uncharacterized membrane protein YgaE (UPF0421/DUF939 family)